MSLSFLFAVCGIAVVMIFGIWGLIEDQSYMSVTYLYGMAMGGGSLFLMTGILPLFAYATTFASEWEQRATSFWLVRTGVRRYAISKVLVSALSGFLTTFVGLALFVLIIRIKLPLSSDASAGGSVYASLVEQGMPIQYFLFHITHFSLTAALFAVIAIWVSTYIPNKFVTIAAPLVIYFVTFRFTTQLPIPEYLKADSIVELIYDAGSPSASLLIKLGIVVLLCTLMGFATVRQIRRRVQRD